MVASPTFENRAPVGAEKWAPGVGNWHASLPIRGGGGHQRKRGAVFRSLKALVGRRRRPSRAALATFPCHQMTLMVHSAISRLVKARNSFVVCFAVVLAIGDLNASAAVKKKQIAEDGESAESHIQKGIELRRSGDDIGALSEYEAAYRIAPTPRAAAQLGICNHALGRWVMAEKFTVEALRSKNDPWVIKNRATLLESVNTVKAHLGFLSFRGEPDGAIVRVNGSVAGTLPTTAPVRVASGMVEVSAKATGFKDWRKSLTVVAGETAEVYVVLEGETGAVQPVPMPVADEHHGGTTMPALAASADTSEKKTFFGRPWVWVAAGSVVAAAVVTAVVLGQTERTENFACMDCVETIGVNVK